MYACVNLKMASDAVSKLSTPRTCNTAMLRIMPTLIFSPSACFLLSPDKNFLHEPLFFSFACLLRARSFAYFHW